MRRKVRSSSRIAPQYRGAGGLPSTISRGRIALEALNLTIPFEEPGSETRTVSDLMTETMVRWGVRWFFTSSTSPTLLSVWTAVQLAAPRLLELALDPRRAEPSGRARRAISKCWLARLEPCRRSPCCRSTAAGTSPCDFPLSQAPRPGRSTSRGKHPYIYVHAHGFEMRPERVGLLRAAMLY